MQELKCTDAEKKVAREVFDAALAAELAEVLAERRSDMRTPATYEIDGRNFVNPEEPYAVVSSVLIPEVSWGCNLDALNDILRGEFETPGEGLVLRWTNSALSRERIGYPETVKQLEVRLVRCHRSHKDSVA